MNIVTSRRHGEGVNLHIIVGYAFDHGYYISTSSKRSTLLLCVCAAAGLWSHVGHHKTIYCCHSREHKSTQYCREM